MRIAFFFLLIAITPGCANKDAIPADIIPKQKMETILWQLIQSDEYSKILLNRDSLKKAGPEKMKIYQQVFDLNGTSMDEFKRSYSFYMEHPNISKVMFDSISATANRQHMDIYSIKTDSLKPVPAAIPASAVMPTMGSLFKRDSLLKSKLRKAKQNQDSIHIQAKRSKRMPGKHKKFILRSSN